jgi:hypothetical protein
MTKNIYWPTKANDGLLYRFISRVDGDHQSLLYCYNDNHNNSSHLIQKKKKNLVIDSDPLVGILSVKPL